MRTRVRTPLVIAAAALVLTATVSAHAEDGTRRTRGRGGIASARTVGGPKSWGASNAALTYHGGPVMRSNSTFAIFWAPSGSTWQSGYRNTIKSYFADVAADSGTKQNVYSTETQYYDSTGHIRYRSTFAGSYVDTAAFPRNGCPAYGGMSVCLTDTQQIAEVHRVTKLLALPEDGTHTYFLFMPESVGSCFDAAGTQCAFSYYCAYHGYDGALLYASMPYAETDDAACGLQGPHASDADATINTASHEHREMINDPYLTAWFDNKGYEGSDKCAWTFGTTTSTSSGPYNQTINGHHYLLQQEWSNASRGCVQRGL
jgi:hypothetical protein